MRTQPSKYGNSPSFGWLKDRAHQAGAWIYPPIGEVFPYDDRYHHPTIEMYRAAATNFRAAGADGLYLSNLPWPRTERDKHAQTGDKGPWS